MIALILASWGGPARLDNYGNLSTVGSQSGPQEL